jgi:hypothetical protein
MQGLLMGSADFAPDFFNNVAAIAVVLVFAKLVTHRSRVNTTRSDRERIILFSFHLLAVVAATVAALAAIIGLRGRSVSGVIDWLAWGGVAIAGLILVGDALVEDCRQAYRR